MNISQSFRLPSRLNISRLVRGVHVETKIESLGLRMPTAAVPKGNFVNYVRVGNIVYLSGHLPQPAEGPLVIGKVGKDITVEDGNDVSMQNFTIFNCFCSLFF